MGRLVGGNKTILAYDCIPKTDDCIPKTEIQRLIKGGVVERTYKKEQFFKEIALIGMIVITFCQPL